LTSIFLIEDNVSINTFVPCSACGIHFESVEACRHTLTGMQANDRLTDNYVARERGGDLIPESRVSPRIVQTLRCVGN
jgi:hypothetical protein